jgi:hypothetical protein
VPLSSVAAWQPAANPHPQRANSTHFFMYAPPLRTIQEQQSVREVIRANQFPTDLAACNHTLVLYDDALTAGLGYSARLISLALLVAVQEKRVLIYAPHHSARWCARPPYTLGCYYEPITHCPSPVNLTAISKWSTRGSSLGLEARRGPQSAAHVRISTSQIHRANFWYKFHPPQPLHDATHELLFRPRSWVRDAARCMMRAASLHRGNYAVVHARYSVEKKKERGARLPGLSEYLPATEALLARANVTRVFLQTSTPEAVDLFEQWSVERGWHLSYTQNLRSKNDLWMAGSGTGKRTEYVATGERASVVAQTVNALIASSSSHFISPSSSMWTNFIRSLWGKRVGVVVSDASGSTDSELHEECASTGNKTQSGEQKDKKCSHKVPRLLEIHKKPANHNQGGGGDEDGGLRGPPER